MAAKTCEGAMIAKRSPRLAIASAPAGLMSVLVMAGACSLAVDLDGLQGGAPADAGADAAMDASPSCQHVTYPPAPATATEGGTIEFAVALRSMDFGESGATVVGLDLDKTCTCLGEGASCVYPPSATKDHCDKSGGRDNAMAQLFSTIGLFVSDFSSAHFSAQAEQGAWSLLIRVAGYNGEADDAEVSVALYPTYWDEVGQGENPLWNGTDVWPVSSGALIDGVSVDQPKYADAKAYVTGNTLVASLPSVFLNVSAGGGDLGIELTAGTLMGTIVNQGGRYKITSGLCAARWKTESIFKIASSINADGMALCKDGSLTYSSFKNLVCGHVDIASSLGGVTTACDSLSFGMSLETEPVFLGSVFTPMPAPPVCSPEQDPATDSCEK
jgi:hypothetical protein